MESPESIEKHVNNWINRLPNEHSDCFESLIIRSITNDRVIDSFSWIANRYNDHHRGRDTIAWNEYK